MNSLQMMTFKAGINETRFVASIVLLCYTDIIYQTKNQQGNYGYI